MKHIFLVFIDKYWSGGNSNLHTTFRYQVSDGDDVKEGEKGEGEKEEENAEEQEEKAKKEVLVMHGLADT